MSTVITAIKGGVIHMIGDTAGSFGNGTQTQSNKVYAGNGYLVGVCGPRDPYLAMLYDFVLPEDTVPYSNTGGGLSKREYIAGPLRSALKDVLSGMEKNSFNLQLGFYYRNDPCIIEISGGVGGMEEVTDMQWVCSGTGREVAIGVMAALWDTDIEVRTLLEKAIEVASKYNAYTSLPSEYLILSK